MAEKIKGFLKNNIDIISFLFILTIKNLLFETQIEKYYTFYFPRLILSNLACILIIIGISILFKSKKRIYFLIIIDLIVSVFLLVDTNYYRYFRDVISIPVIRNGLMLGAVQASISSLLKPQDILYFLDLLLLIPILIKFRGFKVKELKLRNKIGVFVMLFLIGCLLDSYNIQELNKEQPTLLKAMYNRVYVAKEIGDINYHGLDIYNFILSSIAKSQPLSTSEVANIKSYLTTNRALISGGTNLKGIAKGKNLIIIQVEALQQFVINQKINGVEITPNLNRWVQKSTYFNNYFYQVSSGGTSDAELMTNNSLYPAPSGAAYYLYSENNYNSLPKLLDAAGYNNGVFHGYMESFWNRNVMYKAEGFDKFYSERSYNLNETVGMGLSDKSFLTQTLDKMKSLKSPYYSFIITLSSHFPFDDVKGYGNFPVGQFENTLLGDYLKGIHYTDEQLGMFLDNLDNEGVLKNSIVVLYGDHNAISKDKQQDLAKFLNLGDMSDLQWAELQKIPMMIHFPGDANKGTNSTYAGQMDLMPTLLNLYGLNSGDVFGKDLFNTNKNSVTFRNGSFTDGKTFYISQTDSYYDINTGNKVPENAELKKEKEDSITSLQYSDEILEHNLLNQFNSVNK